MTKWAREISFSQRYGQISPENKFSLRYDKLNAENIFESALR